MTGPSIHPASGLQFAPKKCLGENAMRKKIVAGNWKMNGSRTDAEALLKGIANAEIPSDVEVIVFPPFVYLPLASELLKHSSVKWGGQNLHEGKNGAFTGEVSAPMLTDYGCKYVLVGHSERRSLFHEDLPTVARKFKAAQVGGLIPILCVGETLEERKSGNAENIIQQQLASVIEAVSISAFQNAVVAYEPVWAIGTGLTATPEQAQEMHAFIRKELVQHDAAIANKLSILYGGSVKADNAVGLFTMPDIDGGLVGGASLEVKGFLAICQAAVYDVSPQ